MVIGSLYYIGSMDMTLLHTDARTHIHAHTPDICFLSALPGFTHSCGKGQQRHAYKHAQYETDSDRGAPDTVPTKRLAVYPGLTCCPLSPANTNPKDDASWIFKWRNACSSNSCPVARFCRGDGVA